MEFLKLESFTVVGIAVKTSNENGQSANDIKMLWDRFINENIADRIPNKISNEFYSIYIDNEGDHTQPYLTIIGCKVSDVTNIPNGMIAKTVEGGSYAKIACSGDITKGSVYNDWLKIWALNLDRNFKADFEIYGEDAQNPTDAKYDIYVGVK